MFLLRTGLLIGCFGFSVLRINAQCAVPISNFPYREDFETSNGGWTAGGFGSDWAWGTPAKSVISAAGSGSRCWVAGGLTGNAYSDGEASWLQSPCFDFSGLQYPYIEFKVFWEMEQQFDGGSLQYSLDNGVNWANAGSANDAVNCLNGNWFNHSSITYLAALTGTRHGWSGNVQSTTGSCRGGNGSNGWLLARHTLPALAGEPGVIFRFIFGAGTICNNYNGFAVDDFSIKAAPPNQADFTYTCTNNNTVVFNNKSAFCPTTFSWNFGDPAAGLNNIATGPTPTHTFSSPGTYTVELTVSGPGNAPSTLSKQITILGLTTTVLSPADCISGTGGSANVNVTGTPNPSYSWNSAPPQTSATAINLAAQQYSVTVTTPDACPAMAHVTIPLDLSCIGIYFPSAFTPNGDGLNDSFGPLGSLAALSQYQLRIYNRWGQMVFHSRNPFTKWSGGVKGSNQGTNVFTWYAEFSLLGEPKTLRKGTITLIK